LTDELFFLPPLPFQQFNPSELKDFQAVPVSVARYDVTNDVALLRVTTSATVTVPNKMFGTDDQAEVGGSIGYLGYPYARAGQHALKVSGGVLSAKIVSSKGTRQFLFDAMAEEGNSGAL